jgi:trehalose 6-phosphate synthase
MKLTQQKGTVEFTPIHFLHKSVSFDELISLYAVSDVCLVSSTRDGMNLVSYEYIATQKSRHGVMILSEFTGAAQSLNGSIVVNPWNTEELANALYDAVTMSHEQRKINYEKLAAYVGRYTSAWWGQSFVKELSGGMEASSNVKLKQGSNINGVKEKVIAIKTADEIGGDVILRNRCAA